MLILNFECSFLMLIFIFYVPPEVGPRSRRRLFKRWISQEFIFVLSYLHMLNILMKIPLDPLTESCFLHFTLSVHTRIHLMRIQEKHRHIHAL